MATRRHRRRSHKHRKGSRKTRRHRRKMRGGRYDIINKEMGMGSVTSPNATDDEITYSNTQEG